MLLIAGYADNADTTAYALGGMQATCKPARRHIGVFEPQRCRIQQRYFDIYRARQ
jgi:hypothetical protein